MNEKNSTTLDSLNDETLDAVSGGSDHETIITAKRYPKASVPAKALLVGRMCPRCHGKVEEIPDYPNTFKCNNGCGYMKVE